MNNPWLKKNPYMSLWLSGANALASAARAQASASLQRQAAVASREMTQAVFDAWLGAFAAPAPRRRKRR